MKNSRANERSGESEGTVILQAQQTDYTQIWVTAIGALVILVPVILNYLESRRSSHKVDAVVSSLVDDDGRQKIDNVKETVGRLATNIDGAMTELKETIAGKFKAEGKLEGMKEEQARSDLITEPAKVTDAFEGSSVREQIDRIEAGIIEGADTAQAVADDLAASRKRADEVKSADHGAAADAAAKPPPVEEK